MLLRHPEDKEAEMVVVVVLQPSVKGMNFVNLDPMIEPVKEILTHKDDINVV